MDKDGRDRKEYYRERSRLRRQEDRELVNRLKDVPCADCGQRFDPVCMDFHHEGDDKVERISWMMGKRSSKWSILDEAAKCVVLCAVCHRLRHKKGD